jgi:hypothetical protein
VSTASPGDESRSAPAPTRGARDAVELIALVVAPATLLGALLFYFGWARSRAQARYFGVDVDLLGRSNQEYALRSIGAVFWPCALLLGAVLGALVVHAGARRLASARRRRLLLILAACAGAAGLALTVFALVGIWDPRTGDGAVHTPAAFAVGIPVAAYALFVGVTVASAHGSRSIPPLPRAPFVLVAGLVGIFVFWAVGAHADLRGQRLAERTAANLRALPSVTVYSPHRLYLDGLGVEETALPGSDGAYRFRYSGLRLLARAGARNFLVPTRWCRVDRDRSCERHGVTFVLQDSDALRLDFAP